MFKKRVLVLVCVVLALLIAFILVGLKLFHSSPTVTIQEDNVSEAVSVYGMEPPVSTIPGGQKESATQSPSFPLREPTQGGSFRLTERLETARTNLFSTDASARRQAAGIIKRMGSREDLDTLAGLVTDEQDPRTQIVMIRALRKRSTPESIEALSQCLMTDNPRVQRAAALSLGGMKDPAARACLQDALDGGHIKSERVKRLIRKVVVGAPFGQLKDNAAEDG